LPVSVLSHEIRAYAAVAENQTSSYEIAQSLLRHILSFVRADEVFRIRLTSPARQACLREVAATFGYVASPSTPTDLQKITFNGRLTVRNWTTGCSALAKEGRLVLPDDPPAFRHVDQQISILRQDGQRVLVSLFKLESLLAPMLLCLPGRTGVMVPIRKEYVEHLFNDSPQGTFLPRGKAQLAPIRHYFSDRRSLKKFSRGDLIFFYETAKNSGAAAVIAVGRVLNAYLRDDSQLIASDLAPSVFDRTQLTSLGVSKTKTITVFDNVMRLARPVTLDALRSMQCGEAHQLITSQRLSSEQVQSILEKSQ
jgi:predicted RNA-binding protein with PUA-like domain